MFVVQQYSVIGQHFARQVLPPWTALVEAWMKKHIIQYAARHGSMSQPGKSRASFEAERLPPKVPDFRRNLTVGC